MKNFEFEHKGQKLWYSRSLACSIVVIRYDDVEQTIEILATKRGQGCEFNKGKWNVPGGFIDFDENAKDCAIRECYEETGVKLPYDKILIHSLDTTPQGKRQTMIATHYVIFSKNETKDWNFTTEYSELGEVEEIKWIDLADIEKYDWVHNQVEMIKQVVSDLFWLFDIVGRDKYIEFTM